MNKVILLLLTVALLSSIVYAKETSKSFSCDRCGNDITYAFSWTKDSDAKNEVTCSIYSKEAA